MKTALITGASAGIGKALADQFAQQGFNLILVARRSEALEQIKQDLENRYSIQVENQIFDLAVSGQTAALYDTVKHHKIDVLINNAGFGDYDLAWDADLSKVMNMVDLNVRALTDLSLRYIKDYVDEDAVLINVSSVGGYAEVDVAIPYCATKFYVSSFTEGIDFSLRTQGKKLRAKVLAPAGTQSEFHTVAAVGSGIDINKLYNGAVLMTAEQLAESAYQLYVSDKTVGIVNPNNEFELKDAIFPQVALLK
ncbi:SDR family NAD(P)-dependent oxidoreductase [Acinetobacter baumannii]|uniref:SDR family NAD(P)-dependent oxidoreductase n=1 Tax=Acinetobacter calcoaceticus/baumannii complex TaxID=909768 RepID=UPI002446D73B|nr:MULTISPECIES: SDR family NAD(P)-dependent oxidoreductase [Acinetobacter calcoaceticus/baumannii complex]MDH2549375.1 SDR family NAD(P)-dependent oxidoreductase [Acinetobacter baumannii]MDO7244083.1 SDR family NAD(P)-dependent oxidoreductase [Acinetobacter pittii]MDO7505437.1 SDR family NAD(P)-dependent oxidoreductase [Acinetobacter baumannii]MDO7508889.1 SDR family NAD(P)-dependent oxidoreductase [Acinetobacter baumannii]MDO7519890.1 SDR family NAD(P)-dependent oxidoreductase [Acinetobacter